MYIKVLLLEIYLFIEIDIDMGADLGQAIIMFAEK